MQPFQAIRCCAADLGLRFAPSGYVSGDPQRKPPAGPELAYRLPSCACGKVDLALLVGC